MARGLGINGHNHRLATVSFRERHDQRRIAKCGGVQADLVRARLDRRRRIVFTANAAADSERQEDLLRDRVDRIGARLAALDRRGDVEDYDLVDALDVVTAGEGPRIAGLAQAFEGYALPDLAVASIEARDDPLRQHGASSSESAGRRRRTSRGEIERRTRCRAQLPR